MWSCDDNYGAPATACEWNCGRTGGICPEPWVYNELTGKCAWLQENEFQLRSGRTLGSSAKVAENHTLGCVLSVITLCLTRIMGQF